MSRPEYSSVVKIDKFTERASELFDYSFDGTSTFIGYEIPAIPEQYGIGLIVGPSGSGKSLLLREFGAEKELKWHDDLAIISHFPTPDTAVDKLMAVGLNSVPSWCKPYRVLSTGEAFRADLARRLEDGAVIDEFTSVVDRNVARAASRALRRYVDKTLLQKIVVASCHYDIVDWLEPDWVFDTSDGTIRDRGSLQRPNIELRVYPSTSAAWPMFAPHHYLSAKLNKASHAYLATADFGEGEAVVGFVSVLSFPSGHWKNGWREHRTVVLPDFQGLGIGPRLSDIVAQIYIDRGGRFFSRTAHPRFGAYRNASLLWKPTSKNRRLRDDIASNKLRGKATWNSYNADEKRVCFSHEYIGR